MTLKEVQIQKALGTLPFREWMKLKGILFHNNWWHFPILNNKIYLKAKIVIINGAVYFPVADNYIDDLQYSMAWHNWTEDQFATEIIKQCYQCIGGS